MPHPAPDEPPAIGDRVPLRAEDMRGRERVARVQQAAGLDGLREGLTRSGHLRDRLEPEGLIRSSQSGRSASAARVESHPATVSTRTRPSAPTAAAVSVT